MVRTVDELVQDILMRLTCVLGSKLTLAMNIVMTFIIFRYGVQISEGLLWNPKERSFPKKTSSIANVRGSSGPNSQPKWVTVVVGRSIHSGPNSQQ